MRCIETIGGPLTFVRLEGLQEAVRIHGQRIQKVHAAPNVPTAEKRQLIDSYFYAMIRMADSPDTAAEPARTRRAPAPAVAASLPLQPSVTAARQVGADIIACLHASGGTVLGVRALAVRLGRPRSTVSDDLHRLAAAGYVTLTRGARGMELALAARPNESGIGLARPFCVGLGDLRCASLWRFKIVIQ